MHGSLFNDALETNVTKVSNRRASHHIGTWDFQQVSFWHRCFITFGTCTCRHSGRWTLQHRNVLKGTFWHEEFSTRRIFGTKNFGMETFRHSGTGAEILICKVPKYSCAQMSCCQNIPCRNVDGAENSSCQKFLVRKSPHVKTFLSWNIHMPEHWQCRTMHVPKWLLLKSQVAK